mmetsp:Transcript_34611/g.78934  ORF Transcript_34611/g.78934 Transcript_34611/m.78934 type:complete len:239 (-) Transcript_34611:1033-1749(-)
MSALSAPSTLSRNERCPSASRRLSLSGSASLSWPSQSCLASSHRPRRRPTRARPRPARRPTVSSGRRKSPRGQGRSWAGAQRAGPSSRCPTTLLPTSRTPSPAAVVALLPARVLTTPLLQRPPPPLPCGQKRGASRLSRPSHFPRPLVLECSRGEYDRQGLRPMELCSPQPQGQPKQAVCTLTQRQTCQPWRATPTLRTRLSCRCGRWSRCAASQIPRTNATTALLPCSLFLPCPIWW